MVNKKRLNKFNISNKLAYTLIALSCIILLGMGVYAITPGVAPDPGHLLSSIAPPENCGPNEILTWTGTAWDCVTPVTPSNNLQCPSRTAIVDEYSSGWDERAQYKNCTANSDFVTLNDVRICDASTCYRMVAFTNWQYRTNYNHCTYFCNSFGFFANSVATKVTITSGTNNLMERYDYSNNRWETDSFGSVEGIDNCNCYP